MQPGIVLRCPFRAAPLGQHRFCVGARLRSRLVTGRVAGQLEAMTIRIEEINRAEQAVVCGSNDFDSSLEQACASEAQRREIDHLEGNVYYRVSYPLQNLHRAKNQLALLQSQQEHRSRFADFAAKLQER